MSIFAQTGDGDLQLTDGKLTLVEGPQETAIRMRNRLFSVKGEWFADVSRGIPYFELVFVTNPNLDIIENVLTQAIESLPGVAQVEKMELTLDRRTRDLVVTTETRHEDGALIIGGTGTPFIVESY